jgi:hypothetical protein
MLVPICDLISYLGTIYMEEPFSCQLQTHDEQDNPSHSRAPSQAFHQLVLLSHLAGRLPISMLNLFNSGNGIFRQLSHLAAADFSVNKDLNLRSVMNKRVNLRPGYLRTEPTKGPCG